MTKRKLYDIISETDVEINGTLDLEKEVGIAEYGEEIDENTLFILTKTAKGEKREISGVGMPYAVICEGDDGECFPDTIKLYTKNARNTLAICYRNLYGVDTANMRLIAVTGTNGKTTVSRMLHYILRHSGADVGYIGTGTVQINETEVSDKYYSMTTPDPRLLYKYLSDMQMFGCRYVIIEASSHAIALGKLTPLFFDVGIFTNLSSEHRDFHPDMQDYFNVKLSLFERCRHGIFNLDCPYSRRAYQLAGCEKSSIGIINTADVYATDIESRGLMGSSFFYREEGLIFGVDLSMIGAYNIYNALMALRAAIVLGLPPCIAKQGINALCGIDGRMEVISDDVSVVIDYAHTPFAVENTLKTLFSIKRKRQNLLLVIGCGGERDKEKRYEIGSIAEKYCDKIYLTEDNSRGEDTENIIAEILQGIREKDTVTVIPDRRDAIEYAILSAAGGDIIALLGKGREGYIIDKDGYRDFSDKGEALRALRQRKMKNENNA
ncbi:MAG: UDP-N-acetylmuramoyl-L-alanyl-D-glutamate--2,6-diaminopimelate ligase [Clostridia bacterium]|nr:UDP-N-acetylmuramoyl-L-alanyl-D-glutamate--2,6-diaminopimelate ligase [Clostridia bacterium]